MNKFDLNSIDSIVIRVPNWLGDLVMAMPFLSQISDIAQNKKVIIIGKKLFLPIVSEFFPSFCCVDFDKAKYPGLKGMRAFSRQEYFSRRNLYITLAPSLSSALMGFFMRGATFKVGFKGDMRSLFLSKALSLPENKHRSDEYMYIFESLFKKPKSELKLSLKDYDKEILAKYNLEFKKYVIVNVNSEASSRRLSKDKWAELFEYIESKYTEHQFVFVGAPNEVQRVHSYIESYSFKNEVLDLSGKTKILELMNVLKGASLVLSNDSGPAHLASLMGAPVVTIFGAGNEKSTAPQGDLSKVKVIRENLDCSPCVKNECPLKTKACLVHLDTSQAFEFIDTNLD